MSLSRLAYIPPELKLLTYSEFHPHDLLSISHVSQFWRSLVLGDKRWTEWFNLLSTESEETAEAFLSRLKVLDLVSKRAIVTLCFYNKCSGCAEHTTDIFLPLLKRVCVKCRRGEEYAVIAFSSALATYALKESDLGDVLILHWEATERGMGILSKAKLLSQTAVKEIAIQKYGGEANLTTHLEAKRAAARTAYDKRIAEYTAAIEERERLFAAGNIAAAEAVGIGEKNKRIPKSRPALPPILKSSETSPFYQQFVLFQSGFLSFEAGDVSLRKLVHCRLCIMMENLRVDEEKSLWDYTSEWKHPGMMPAENLARHRLEAHYDREDAECLSNCQENREGRCAICLNVSAIFIAREFGSEFSDDEDEDGSPDS
ncbi:hypothetical protein DFH06DRAFT_1208512 [Mycena polygramma]|nr:hypothetical protein DFH06DRAFT_1208512 [Mycena polygramma]